MSSRKYINNFHIRGTCETTLFNAERRITDPCVNSRIWLFLHHLPRERSTVIGYLGGQSLIQKVTNLHFWQGAVKRPQVSAQQQA